MPGRKHGGLFGKVKREAERVIDNKHIGTVVNAVLDGTSVPKALEAANHPERAATTAQPQQSDQIVPVGQQNEAKLDFEQTTPTGHSTSDLEAGTFAQAVDASVSDSQAFNILNISHEVAYRAPAEQQAAQNVEHKDAQEGQSVIPAVQPVLSLQPPPYDNDNDAPPVQEDPAVVVHAQFAAPSLSPRSTTLLSQLTELQGELRTAHTQKIEDGAEQDAAFLNGALLKISAMKRTVRREPDIAAMTAGVNPMTGTVVKAGFK